jgi:hypothetical protein
MRPTGFRSPAVDLPRAASPSSRLGRRGGVALVLAISAFAAVTACTPGATSSAPPTVPADASGSAGPPATGTPAGSASGSPSGSPLPSYALDY